MSATDEQETMNECTGCEGMPQSAGPAAQRFDPGTEAWQHRFPGRATKWQLRSHTLTFGRRPLVMGILNCTPDSFSDGGQFVDCGAAVEHAVRMVADGANLIDVGGESTRPYSEPVTTTEELDRVLPVIRELSRRILVPISIDTSKAEVARAATLAGAEIINDVTGMTGDPAMMEVALQSQAGVCAMHMQGTPQNMQDHPTYDNVVEDILTWLQARRDRLEAAGIPRERICLDPGIGFGKTHQHNLTLLAHCHRFHELGCPLLLGPSRKGFIGKILGDKNLDRDWGTVGACLSLASQGVQVLRVHNAAAVHHSLMLYEATGGIDGQANLVD